MARLTSRQLNGWLRFYRDSPFDDERIDTGFGIVASTIVNLFPGEPTSPLDFMPYTEKTKTPKPDLKAEMTALFGDRIVREQKQCPD